MTSKSNSQKGSNRLINLGGQRSKIYKRDNKIQSSLKIDRQQRPRSAMNISRQMDGILRKDYTQWKKNQHQFNAVDCQTAKNTQLIQHYIKRIYQDYDILDPLSGESVFINEKKYLQNPERDIVLGGSRPASQRSLIAQQKVHFTQNYEDKHLFMTPTKPTNNVKPQKFHGLYNDGGRFTDFKVNPNDRTAPSHASTYYVNSGKTVYTDLSTLKSGAQHGQIIKFRESNSRPSQSFQVFQNHISRPSQYPNLSRQLIDSHYTTSTFHNIYEQGKPLQQRQKLKQYTQKLVHAIQTKRSFDFNEPIKQSFRYCVGCQNAILQANVKSHQLSCNQFLRIMNLTNSDLVKEIEKKINKIKSQIEEKNNKISQKDTPQLLANSRALVLTIPSSYLFPSPLHSNNFTQPYSKSITIGNQQTQMVLNGQIKSIKISQIRAELKQIVKK